MYLLQFSGKTMGVVGATATLLDAICTSTVSAATASSYLSAELAHLPISPAVITILLLVGLGLLALAGLRESASVSAAIFAFHVCVFRKINPSLPDSISVADYGGSLRNIRRALGINGFTHICAES